MIQPNRVACIITLLVKREASKEARRGRKVNNQPTKSAVHACTFSNKVDEYLSTRSVTMSPPSPNYILTISVLFIACLVTAVYASASWNNSTSFDQVLFAPEQINAHGTLRYVCVICSIPTGDCLLLIKLLNSS
jgi:hypothetical protein